jgi:hypothetical protein
MRIREILEAKPAYSDPLKAGSTRPWEDSPEEKYLERSLSLDNGQLPPEVKDILGPTGLYDPNKVTPEWMNKVANAHPNDRKWKDFATVNSMAASAGNWITGKDKQIQRDLDGQISKIKADIEAFNKSYRPAGHYYNNRPYKQGIVQGHRADPKTMTVEPQSHNYDPIDIKYYLSAYKWARDKGLIPVITPEEWVMLLLVEGSEEFGARGEQAQNLSPAMKKFQANLEKQGMTNYGQLVFCTTVMDKITTARRLKIPLYQAWNGSKMYLNRYNAQALAVKDPKNKPLVDLITSTLA